MAYFSNIEFHQCRRYVTAIKFYLRICSVACYFFCLLFCNRCNLQTTVIKQSVKTLLLNFNLKIATVTYHKLLDLHEQFLYLTKHNTGICLSDCGLFNSVLQSHRGLTKNFIHIQFDS